MIFQLLWYYYSNIWPFWQCIEERDEGKKAKEKQGKKKSRMIFILAQPILALKKLFRSTLLPKAVERRCIYYVIFPRKTTYSKTAKKKLGLWSYSLQGQEVNQVYCENALEFIQDFFFLLGDNFFFAFFHWKRHISTTYIPLKEKEWVYNGISGFLWKLDSTWKYISIM